MTEVLVIKSATDILLALMVLVTAAEIIINRKDRKTKAEKMQLIAYAVYQLSVQLEKLNKENQWEETEHGGSESEGSDEPGNTSSC